MKKRVSLFLLVVAVLIAVSLFSLVSIGGHDLPACTDNAPFTITGKVVNSTYGEANSDDAIIVNVSIYNMTYSSGEPSRTLVNVTNTTSVDGNFSIVVGDGLCDSLYILEAVIYDISSRWPLEVGPSFPPLPLGALTDVFNTSTIYTTNATLLNLTAINSSWTESHNITFNYIIFDDALGFPIAENFETSTNNATEIVPAGRNYTVLFMKAPTQGDADSFVSAVPPIPYTINLTQNPTLYRNSPYLVTGNMSFSLYKINGTINVTGNTTVVNITNVLLKLGINGLMPPNSEMSAMVGAPTVTNRSGGDVTSGYYIADYSVNVLGATNGIYQVLEWYAANHTATAAGDGDYFAYFQNFTVTTVNITYNVVLQGLAGNVATKSEGVTNLKTRFIAINVTNANNEPLDDANMEIRVDAPGHKTTLPTFRHMIFSLSGGLTRIPMINTSNATLRIFNRRYAPSNIKLNITNASLYPSGIIQVRMSTFKPRRFNSDGTFTEFNSTNQASNFRLVFMKNTADCNVYDPSILNCKIGTEDFDLNNFDPLKTMFGGKVNIYSVMNTTGVIIYFIGVDMIASGPPEGSMSESALRETQTSAGDTDIRTQVWRFGSLAPPIYDKVFVGIPYNQSQFNETALFNITYKYLLDSDGNVIWNSTTYPNGTSIPDDFADYNVSWLNTSAGGMRCVNETDGSPPSVQQCFVNTSTNYVWMNLPHFSDGDPELSGEADTTPPVKGPRLVAANVSDNDDDGNIEINWTEPDDETGETYIVYRFTSNITTFNHSLTNLTPLRVAEGVMFFEDNTTTGDNATEYWYAVVAVDSAGNLNTSDGAVNLSESLNATANDTIVPKPVTGLNVSVSGAIATLTWLSVTQDINNNADASGLLYKVYRSDANANVNASRYPYVNTSDSNFGITIPVGTTYSTNTTTYTATANGTYHFIVTSIDDNNNENISFVQSGSNANFLNVSLTATPDSPSGGGSSGGGSSGGGSSTADPNAGTSQSRAWDKLTAGTEATFKVTKTGIPITSITFKVTEDVEDIELTVTRLTRKPSSVATDYGGKIYNYITIKKSNLKDTSVASATIAFKVERKWLGANNAKAAEVLLLRYNRKKWDELPVKITDNDDVHFFYEAESPGFSTFVIALREVVTAETTGADDAQDQEANATAAANETDASGDSADSDVSKGKVLLYTAIIIIIVALIAGIMGFIYYRKSKSGIGEEEESSESEEIKPKTQS